MHEPRLGCMRGCSAVLWIVLLIAVLTYTADYATAHVFCRAPPCTWNEDLSLAAIIIGGLTLVAQLLLETILAFGRWAARRRERRAIRDTLTYGDL